MLLVAVTGSVADRFDRRRIVSIGLVGEAVAVRRAGLARRPVGSTEVWPIYALVIAFGAARAFVTPGAAVDATGPRTGRRAAPADRLRLGRMADRSDRRTGAGRVPLRRLSHRALPGVRRAHAHRRGRHPVRPTPSRPRHRPAVADRLAVGRSHRPRRRGPRRRVARRPGRGLRRGLRIRQRPGGHPRPVEGPAPRGVRGPAGHPGQPGAARRHLPRSVRRALRRRRRPAAGTGGEPLRGRRRRPRLAARRHRHRRRHRHDLA